MNNNLVNPRIAVNSSWWTCDTRNRLLNIPVTIILRYFPEAQQSHSRVGYSSILEVKFIMTNGTGRLNHGQRTRFHKTACYLTSAYLLEPKVDNWCRLNNTGVSYLRSAAWRKHSASPKGSENSGGTLSFGSTGSGVACNEWERRAGKAVCTTRDHRQTAFLRSRWRPPEPVRYCGGRRSCDNTVESTFFTRDIWNKSVFRLGHCQHVSFESTGVDLCKQIQINTEKENIMAMMILYLAHQ